MPSKKKRVTGLGLRDAYLAARIRGVRQPRGGPEAVRRAAQGDARGGGGCEGRRVLLRSASSRSPRYSGTVEGRGTSVSDTFGAKTDNRHLQ